MIRIIYVDYWLTIHPKACQLTLYFELYLDIGSWLQTTRFDDIFTRYYSPQDRLKMKPEKEWPLSIVKMTLNWHKLTWDDIKNNIDVAPTLPAQIMSGCLLQSIDTFNGPLRNRMTWNLYIVRNSFSVNVLSKNFCLKSTDNSFNEQNFEQLSINMIEKEHSQKDIILQFIIYQFHFSTFLISLPLPPTSVFNVSLFLNLTECWSVIVDIALLDLSK